MTLSVIEWLTASAARAANGGRGKREESGHVPRLHAL